MAIATGGGTVSALKNGSKLIIKISKASISRLRGLKGEALLSALAKESEGAASKLTIGERVSGPNCFVAGTPLLTPEGEKPVEHFVAGDYVLSRNQHDVNGNIEPKVVEEVFIRTGLVTNLRVRGTSIRTTEEHPFYVRGIGWKTVEALQPGDQLVLHDGQVVAVEAVKITGEYVKLYNLRVADYHTYFVGCTAWGFSVWAHNADYIVVRDMNGGYRLAFEDGTLVPGRVAKIRGSTLEELTINAENAGLNASRTPTQVFQDARKAFKESGGPRDKFIEANNLEKGTWVHHSVELQVLQEFPGIFTEAELNAAANLRGIPSAINPEVHLSKIRTAWNRFYVQVRADMAKGIQPTRQQFLDKAAEIDGEFGSQFTPPVKR